MRRLRAACCAAWLLFHGAQIAPGAERIPSNQQFTIDADFPAGNIVVEKIDGDLIRLHQDERDTPRFWFHWHFRVRGAAGRTLTFEFTKENVFGSRGPAVSSDDGRTWTWLGLSATNGDTFRYAFPRDAGDVRFAFAVPYTEADLHAFLKRHKESGALRRDELATTPRGRVVELLRAGRLDGQAKHRILLTCRHHACESVADFVLEGVLHAALAESQIGRWFREQVEIVAVPFMDKDGVEAGDQGKMRRPHDHWLDYEGESIYASTRALRKLVEKEPRRAIDVALDIHCPYIRDEKVYFALGSDARIAGESTRFCRLFEQSCEGPLAYRTRDDSPFGTGWNTSPTYAGRRSFWQWAQSLPGVRVAATLEVPYASVGETDVTPDNARALGRDLAKALKTFLERSD